MSGVADTHGALAWLTVAITIVVLVVALLAASGRASRASVDGAVLGLLAAVVATAAVGAALPVAGSSPRDPLHFLYAVVALIVPPGARYAARSRDARRVGQFVAAGAAITLAAMLRLFMTGR